MFWETRSKKHDSKAVCIHWLSFKIIDFHHLKQRCILGYIQSEAAVGLTFEISLYKQCLTIWPRHKSLLYKQNSFRNILKNFKNILCLYEAKHVWWAMFCVVAQRSNIVFHKRISNVWQTNVWSFGEGFRVYTVSLGLSSYLFSFNLI